jgi:hypothetical protein
MSKVCSRPSVASVTGSAAKVAKAIDPRLP